MAPSSLEAILELRANDYEASPALLEYVTNLFSMLGQTKVIEDGFHFERRGEKQQDNKIMASDRRWLLLLEHKVLSGVHSYKDLDWLSMQIPRGCKDKPLDELFSERVRDTSMDMTDVIGTSQTTKWYSPNVHMESRMQVDLEVARMCHERNWWALAPHTWLASMGRLPNLMLKNSTLYGDVFYFVLGDLGCSGLWGWPSEAGP